MATSCVLNFAKGISLVVQRLGLCTLTAEGPVSVLGQGTRLPLAARRGQKQKKRRNLNIEVHTHREHTM